MNIKNPKIIGSSIIILLLAVVSIYIFSDDAKQKTLDLEQENLDHEISLRDYWPTRGWRSSTPENQSMDGILLEQLHSHILDNVNSIDTMLIIKNGYIVSEHYYKSFYENIPHNVYSATKSFTSTLSELDFRL